MNVQGDCCSCYAFSAVETLEGVNALASDHLVELSAQNILDCSGLQCVNKLVTNDSTFF